MKKVVLSVIILAFVLSASALAVTRFYLPSTGTAAVSPVFTTAGWGDTTTGAPDRIRCLTHKTNSAITNKAVTVNSSSLTVLNRQYVSDPIAAQTIGGTVQGQLIGACSKTTYSSITIRIVSAEGTMVRGTLLAIKNGTFAYPDPTAANRYTPVPGTALTVVTPESGDRIVIEIGFDRTATGNTATNQYFGDNGTTDLGSNESETSTTANPWVEFSQDIKFPSVSVND